MTIILASKNRKEIIISVLTGKGLHTLPSKETITNNIEKLVDILMRVNGKPVTRNNKYMHNPGIITGLDAIFNASI